MTNLDYKDEPLAYPVTSPYTVTTSGSYWAFCSVGNNCWFWTACQSGKLFYQQTLQCLVGDCRSRNTEEILLFASSPGTTCGTQYLFSTLGATQALTALICGTEGSYLLVSPTSSKFPIILPFRYSTESTKRRPQPRVLLPASRLRNTRLRPRLCPHLPPLVL